MRGLYWFSMLLFQWGIALAGLFSEKARKRYRENKHFLSLSSPKIGDKVLWLHCASLGEFEQGRPIIESIRKNKPELRILLTFFSPSGFDIRKNYSEADWVTYLPFDRFSYIKPFLDKFKPDVALFVKYEFWHNFIAEIDKRQIPLYLVSGIFRKDQAFFKCYGRFFRNTLKKFRYFYLQNSESLALLSQIGIDNAEVAGDTRFDRVLEIAEEKKSFEKIDLFCGTSPVFVAGSTWPEDEKVLFPVLKTVLPDDWKIIIAPHELGQSHISKIVKVFDEDAIVCYTHADDVSVQQAHILVLDTMGMLSAVYQKGAIAYIGGGFGVGIHNTLEPAAFGLPVIFGPEHKKFQEAKELLSKGGAFSFSKEKELSAIIENLIDGERHNAGRKSAEYVRANAGATSKIVTQLLLT